MKHTHRKNRPYIGIDPPTPAYRPRPSSLFPPPPASYSFSQKPLIYTTEMVRKILYQINDQQKGDILIAEAAGRIVEILEEAARVQWYERMAREAAGPRYEVEWDKDKATAVYPIEAEMEELKAWAKGGIGLTYDEWKQHKNRYERELEEDRDRIIKNRNKLTEEINKKSPPLRGEQGDTPLTRAAHRQNMTATEMIEAQRKNNKRFEEIFDRMRDD